MKSLDFKLAKSEKVMISCIIISLTLIISLLIILIPPTSNSNGKGTIIWVNIGKVNIPIFLPDESNKK